METHDFCEICGAPATAASIDSKEGEPVKGKDGRLWATWKKDGAAHFRCDAHPHYPIITWDDGTQMVMLAGGMDLIATPALLKAIGHS